jgi:hypothetical protein
MIEFIDKTSATSGTPLNRKNLMALQGFFANTLTFNADGTITETNGDGGILTTIFNEDGSITEKFEGEKVITKTTYFNTSGTITEVVG